MSLLIWSGTAVVLAVLAMLGSRGTLARTKLISVPSGLLWLATVVGGMYTAYKLNDVTHWFYAMGWITAGYVIFMLFGPFAFHGDDQTAR